MDAIKAEDALLSIPCSECGYDEWRNLAMSFRDAGGTLAAWDAWCRSDPGRYDEKAAINVYANPEVGAVRGGGRPVTALTLWKKAREHGWRWHDGQTPSPKAHRASCRDENPPPSDRVPVPMERLSPAEQAAAQIEAMFNPDESVCVVTKAMPDPHGKLRPAEAGRVYNAGELAARLRETTDIEVALGRPYDHQAGAWIRVNPVVGKGSSDKDVAAWRHALIESDELPVDEQRMLMLELGLPAATIVESGGKSLHALVKVDAEGPRHYATCVARLHQLCNAAGLKVDPANRNPSRLTRLAGAQRGQAEQTLLHVNAGSKDFEAWASGLESEVPEKTPAVEGEAGDLPPIACLDLSTPPALKPPLVEGVLRRGHKLLISGPSKAGKSYLLIQLAEAIALGDTWLGFQCAKGRVLYLNFEIDQESFKKRILDVSNRKGYSASAIESGIHVWNLRGYGGPLAELVPAIVEAAKAAGGFDAIILDPIYKVLAGDENSSRDVGLFCNALDRIASQLEAAVVYCHHHSKGIQGSKTAQDRASGSGVFARDADALLDLIALEVPDEVALDTRLGEHDTVWRVSGVLREFRAFSPFDVIWSWPVHVRDREGSFAKCSSLTASMKGGRARAEQREEENADKTRFVESVALRIIEEYGGTRAEAEKLFEAMPWQKRTTKKWLDCCKSVRLVTEKGVLYIERRLVEGCSRASTESLQERQ